MMLTVVDLMLIHLRRSRVVKPANETERVIVEIWAEILCMDKVESDLDWYISTTTIFYIISYYIACHITDSLSFI